MCIYVCVLTEKLHRHQCGLFQSAKLQRRNRLHKQSRSRPVWGNRWYHTHGPFSWSCYEESEAKFASDKVHRHSYFVFFLGKLCKRARSLLAVTNWNILNCSNKSITDTWDEFCYWQTSTNTNMFGKKKKRNQETFFLLVWGHEAFLIQRLKLGFPGERSHGSDIVKGLCGNLRKKTTNHILYLSTPAL